MTVFAVDFDGTIVHNTYPNIGILRYDALKTLKAMRAHGHVIIIWTCRCGPRLLEMEHFLEDHDVPYDVINDHAPHLAAIFGGEARKIFADYYIDDHNVSSWTWQDVMKIVEQTPCP